MAIRWPQLVIILKDGIRYLPYRYKNELELQNLVQSNIHYLFGSDTFFFPGVRIGAGRGQNGAKGIPDGFVLSVPQNRWYIIEVELAHHSYFDHIAPQVMRFYAAWEDDRRRKELINRFADAIQESPVKVETMARYGINEVYRFVSDLLENRPTLAVIIDEEVKDLDQLKSVVQFDVQSSVFRTFTREGVSELVPIFVIDTLEEVKRAPEPLSSPEGKEYLVFLNIREQISTTKEILFKVANELVRRGALTEKMLPWGPGKKRFLISKTPVHPSGKDFFAPVQLKNGWWVETHSGRQSTLSYANHLVKKCGFDSQVMVEVA